MSSKIRCAAAALALLLLLSAGAAHARPSGAMVPAGSFEGLCQWVVSGWSSFWAKAGGDMDPDGLVAPRVSDEGGEMDPNGVQRKEGGEMDPDGLVAPRVSDEGSDMDPNG